MILSVFIQISVNQVKSLVNDHVLDKLLTLFKSKRYGYYLIFLLMINSAFFPYYLKVSFQTILNLLDVLIEVFYQYVLLLLLNFCIIQYFYIIENDQIKKNNELNKEPDNNKTNLTQTDKKNKENKTEKDHNKKNDILDITFFQNIFSQLNNSFKQSLEKVDTDSDSLSNEEDKEYISKTPVIEEPKESFLEISNEHIEDLIESPIIENNKNNSVDELLSKFDDISYKNNIEISDTDNTEYENYNTDQSEIKNMNVKDMSEEEIEKILLSRISDSSKSSSSSKKIKKSSSRTSKKSFISSSDEELTENNKKNKKTKEKKQTKTLQKNDDEILDVVLQTGDDGILRIVKTSEADPNKPHETSFL